MFRSRRLPGPSEFQTEAAEFFTSLAAAKTFDDISRLWASWSMPYRYRSSDPFSDGYRDEVLRLYEAMAGCGYVTENELTSTRLSEEDFRIGFPYSTRSLGVIASESTKAIQALRALHVEGTTTRRILEFGVGWGNVALPLAKAGCDVTGIDIDNAFLDRLKLLAVEAQVAIDLRYGDFIVAAKTLVDEGAQFDAIVFQSSFHHCLEFLELVDLCAQLLTDRGEVLLLSEPIFDDYPFEWGLRFDGESVWAIIGNHWLELGFRRSFFESMFERAGFTLATVPGIEGFVGPGWRAVRNR